MSNSKRIQAQVLNFPSSRLLWINAYLPTDPRTIVFDETELLAVLGDIEAVLDNTHYDDVLISGDELGYVSAVRLFCNYEKIS